MVSGITLGGFSEGFNRAQKRGLQKQRLGLQSRALDINEQQLDQKKLNQQMDRTTEFLKGYVEAIAKTKASGEEPIPEFVTTARGLASQLDRFAVQTGIGGNPGTAMLQAALNTPRELSETERSAANVGRVSETLRGQGVEGATPSSVAQAQGLIPTPKKEDRRFATVLDTEGEVLQSGFFTDSQLSRFTNSGLTVQSAPPDEEDAQFATVLDKDGNLVQSGFFKEEQLKDFTSRGLNVNRQATQQINIGGEASPSDEKLAEIFGTRAQEIMQAGQSAQNRLNQLSQIRAALATEQFETGAFAQQRVVLSQVLDLLGVDPSEVSGILGETASAEVIDAATKRLAVELQDSLSGRASNFRLQLLVDSLPNLTRSREGNELLVDILEREAQLESQKAESVEKFLLDNNAFVDEEGRTMNDVIREFERNNPLFTERLEQRFNDLTKNVPETPQVLQGKARMLTNPDGSPVRDDEGFIQYEVIRPFKAGDTEFNPGDIVRSLSGRSRTGSTSAED